VKTGVQGIYKSTTILDSGFRRNDGKPQIQTFCEIIKTKERKFFAIFLPDLFFILKKPSYLGYKDFKSVREVWARREKNHRSK